MKREHHRWHSPSLGRDMELLVFGHGGAKVVAFPTSAGRFFDWEDRGLIGAVAGPIAAGHFQICCVDSVDRESWYARHKSPAERSARQSEYDAYLLHEVVPLLDGVNGHPYWIAAGASFGGYHAVNFGLRHPDRVNRVLSMSGLCDIGWFAQGDHDGATYFNNPVEYIANEYDPARLELLRRQDIILAVGRDDRLHGTNVRLSQALWRKNIWHALREWDGFAHDWPQWQRMLQLYLGGHD